MLTVKGSNWKDNIEGKIGRHAHNSIPNFIDPLIGFDQSNVSY